MRWLTALLLALSLSLSVAVADPLPSWRDGPTKQAITAFVAAVTQAGGAMASGTETSAMVRAAVRSPGRLRRGWWRRTRPTSCTAI